MKKLLLILFCFLSLLLYGQEKQGIDLKQPFLDHLEKHPISIVDSTHLYIGDGYTTKLFYYALVPKHKVKGTLILLPPTGQTVEAVINQLHLLGNEQAEYINALGKGYRMDGRRHPHSWSIVDAEDCVDWLLGCMDLK